jgi:hypothetical protein
MLISWYQYAQLICLAASIICFHGLERYSISAFVLLLLIINITELVAANYNLQGDNYFIYNLYILASTPVWLYLFYIMLDLDGRAATIFKVTAMLIVLVIVLNFIFLQGINRFNSYSEILISIISIIFSCLVLFSLSMKDLPGRLFHHPYFWINALTFLFNLVTLVLLGLQQYILANDIEIENKTLYHAILPTANVVLYAGYSYAFFLCLKAPSSSLR